MVYFIRRSLTIFCHSRCFSSFDRAIPLARERGNKLRRKKNVRETRTPNYQLRSTSVMLSCPNWHDSSRPRCCWVCWYRHSYHDIIYAVAITRYKSLVMCWPASSPSLHCVPQMLCCMQYCLFLPSPCATLRRHAVCAVQLAVIAQ